MKIKPHLGSMAVFMMLLVCSPDAFSQDLSDEELAYVGALNEVLSDWESNKIALYKDDNVNKEFDVRLAAFKARQVHGDIEAAISSDFVIGNWKKLPDKVLAELPLSKGAKLILAGGVVDAMAQLKQIGVEPNSASVQEKLSFALYATLAAAQEEAKASGSNEIDAIALRRGGFWLFSLGWPFCCAEPQGGG